MLLDTQTSTFIRSAYFVTFMFSVYLRRAPWHGQQRVSLLIHVFSCNVDFVCWCTRRNVSLFLVSSNSSNGTTRRDVEKCPCSTGGSVTGFESQIWAFVLFRFPVFSASGPSEVIWTGVWGSLLQNESAVKLLYRKVLELKYTTCNFMSDRSWYCWFGSQGQGSLQCEDGYPEPAPVCLVSKRITKRVRMLSMHGRTWSTCSQHNFRIGLQYTTKGTDSVIFLTDWLVPVARVDQ